VLTISGLENKIQSELIAMVFSNVIAKHTAEEFHGNIDIQKEMETTTTMELRKTLGLWGLDLIKMFSVWKEGAFDELMKYKGELEIHDGEQDMYNQSMIKVVQRRHDYNMNILESQWDLKLGDVKGDERLKTERFLSELERGKAKFDEDIHREREKIEVGKEERKAVLETDRERMDMELTKDKEEMEITMSSFERVQAAKRERMKLDQDYKTQQMEMQTGSTEKIISQAIQSGVADSETLKEMMRQQTMQKMADRDADKVKALADAEGKRYEMDATKSAEDRERDYETKRMDLSAKQMSAAKQNVPQTLVQGASSTPSVTHIAPTKDTGGLLCPNCQSTIERDWLACPGCGHQLKESTSCPNCGASIQTNWKACPKCGNSLNP